MTINGIIINGKVYVADSAHCDCPECDLALTCKDFTEKTLDVLCAAFGADMDNDFGYRFDQQLTDKLNDK